MPRYVAFLGGINVGGHRCSMETLRAAFEALGLRDVSTFIASGNVLFGADGRDGLEERVEEHLRERLGYAVPTFVRTAEAVVALPGACPHPTEGGTVAVGFLRGPVDPAAVADLVTEVDRLRIVGTELWWRVEGGLTDSLIPPKALGRAVGPMTTRNLNTVRRLADKLGTTS
jgi:uncharacterized protein (DUF1697 family)